MKVLGIIKGRKFDPTIHLIKKKKGNNAIILYFPVLLYKLNLILTLFSPGGLFEALINFKRLLL